MRRFRFRFAVALLGVVTSIAAAGASRRGFGLQQRTAPEDDATTVNAVYVINYTNAPSGPAWIRITATGRFSVNTQISNGTCEIFSDENLTALRKVDTLYSIVGTQGGHQQRLNGKNTATVNNADKGSFDKAQPVTASCGFTIGNWASYEDSITVLPEE